MPRIIPPMLLVTVLAFVIALPAHAQMKDENLLVSVPAGYKIGYRAHNSKQLITEMVPKDETVEDWSEMVMVQIYRELKTVAPKDFRSHIRRQWNAACAGSSIADEGDKTVNRYPAATWMLVCPLNPKSGKPEVTMFKAIQGRDSLYVVQKAFKWTPRPDEKTSWGIYLEKITVCDTRLPDRACPVAN